MAAKAKASDEGAAAQSVAEDAQGAPQPGAEPAAQANEAKAPEEAGTALAATLSPAPGQLSPHQKHSWNYVTRAQIDYDTFRAGHESLLTEMDGKQKAFEAARAERELQYRTSEDKLRETHDAECSELAARIEDMRVGMEIANSVSDRYNQLVPQTKNIRAEQQESEQ